MKIKPRTIRAYHKWSETHKQSDTFIWAGQPIKGSDFAELIGAKPKAKHQEPINTDIQEETDADMGEPLDSRDPEEY